MKRDWIHATLSAAAYVVKETESSFHKCLFLFVLPCYVVQLGSQVQVGHDLRSVGRRMDAGLQNFRDEMNSLKMTYRATLQ